MGYVYILKNRSYLESVVKIGKTTVCPKLRAKQLYSGSTGVPEHFDVIFSCEVPDCDLAEKLIHKVLSSYRKNKRREFFYLPSNIAKQAVVDICISYFGNGNINVIINENSSDYMSWYNSSYDYNDSEVSIELEKDGFLKSMIGTSYLTKEQNLRVSIIRCIFLLVFPCSINQINSNFSRDLNPESEIEIWEHLAKAYMKVSTADFVTDEFKKEAYALLLRRTMTSKTNVLKHRVEKLINESMAKKILDAYELKPKPIMVKKFD